MWVQLLSGWARDIVIVVGLAVIVEMLMPRGAFRRFGHLVMGLFVLLAMAKPMIAMLEIAVTLPGGRISAVREGSAYVWQPAAQPASPDPASSPPAPGWPAASSPATVSAASMLEDQISRTVAWGLGLDARDISVQVWLEEGRTGWPTRPTRIMVRLTRLPPMTAETGGEPGTGVGTAALSEALAVQIGSLYRLEPRLVEIILPR